MELREFAERILLTHPGALVSHLEHHIVAFRADPHDDLGVGDEPAGLGPDGCRVVAAIKQKISTERQQQVANILTALFGTPDDPFVDDALSDKLDITKIRRAAGPAISDINSRKSGLFREHCVHCHGISGDGMGSEAVQFYIL